MNNIKDLYFKWLCSLAFNDKETRDLYSLVLYILYMTEFKYVIPLDKNRLNDGLELRWTFSCDCKIPYDIVQSELNQPCNILEMMVALASRCEKYIMSNLVYGDRTTVWFSTMFNNLTLNEYPNDIMNRPEMRLYIEDLLNIFMFRNYNYDGSNGNIIILPGTIHDLRQLELWDQVCLYTNQLLQMED